MVINTMLVLFSTAEYICFSTLTLPPISLLLFVYMSRYTMMIMSRKKTVAALSSGHGFTECEALECFPI